MTEKYTPPQYKKSAYHCPICKVYAQQDWEDLKFYYTGYGHDTATVGEGSYDVWGAKCSHCNKSSLWIFDKTKKIAKMIFPEVYDVPQPNQDLNKTIRRLYNEAALIVNHSSRASCALLRLALEILCMNEGANDDNLPEGKRRLSDRINYLVKEMGLSVEIAEAFHNVRHAGNEALHTGEINLTDDKSIALELFEMINIIADDLITRKKKIKKNEFKLLILIS